jgi:hypothetical protein
LNIIGRWITVGVVALIALVALFMWGMPRYRIYRQELRGQAALREANWDRQILVASARAKAESDSIEAWGRLSAARLDNVRDSVQAVGEAAAHRIIGENLNDERLRYLWIKSMERGQASVIYVPTEAGLPILEARPR